MPIGLLVSAASDAPGEEGMYGVPDGGNAGVDYLLAELLRYVPVFILGWGNGNPRACYARCRKTTSTFES